jgi:acyl carrier protein
VLRDKVARVLGTSADRIDGERPLLQLGLDSLMAVELRNWIEDELQINLPIVELMRSPTLARLADALQEKLAESDTPAGAPAAGNGEAVEQTNGHVPTELGAAPQELLARVGEMSGEEVDSLLAELLKEKEGGG